MQTKTKKITGLSAPTKPKIRTFFIDENGDNKVMIKSTTKTKTVFLLLKGEGRKRKIGVITLSTRAMTIERKREEHLFRKNSSYGFNEYVLRKALDFDDIMLSDEHSHWRIPRTFILENGMYLNFSQNGFELQQFVSLEQIEQFRVRKEENRRL